MGFKVSTEKLSEKQVRIIKHANSFGVDGTAKWLAKMFKVSIQTIYDVFHGKTWNHIKI